MSCIETIFRVVITILILNSNNIQNLHAQQFSSYVSDIITTDKNTNRIIEKQVNKELQKAISLSDTTTIIQQLLLKSNLERVNLDYSSSFNHAGDALFIAEEYNDSYLLAKAHEEVGVLNYLFNQNKNTGFHFKNSYELIRTLYKTNRATDADLYRAYYNMILYYNRKSDLNMSKCYIDSCSTLSQTAYLDPIYKIFLNEKQANIDIKNNKLDTALYHLNSSAKVLEQLNNNSKEAFKYKSFLIILYYKLASIYSNQGKKKLAQVYFEKSINEPDYFGEHTFLISHILTRYALLLNEEGNTDKAYNKLVIAKKIDDTYLNPRKENPKGFLTVKNRYKEVLRQKNDQLSLKNLELAASKQKVLKFQILIIFLLLLVAVGIFFFAIRYQYIQHRKENEDNALKQQLAKSKIDEQNKELSASMLQLIEKQEIIKTLNDSLNKSPQNRRLLTSLEKQSDNMWEAFNIRFMDLNKDFYDRLKMDVPGLNSTDLKLCALIKLNFSSKEMSHLLGVSEGSVNVSRHRLRKKINLEREDNLTEFIHSL